MASWFSRRCETSPGDARCCRAPQHEDLKPHPEEAPTGRANARPMISSAPSRRMKPLPEPMTTSELDEHFLRRSFDVARRAMIRGNHPFGAILVDGNRNVLIETENGYMPAHDRTGHAERLLARRPRPAPRLARRCCGMPRCIHPPNPAPCAPARSTGQVLAAWSTA